MFLIHGTQHNTVSANHDPSSVMGNSGVWSLDLDPYAMFILQ